MIISGIRTMFMHFVFIQTSLQSALAYFLIHHDHSGALFDTDIHEITFSRKTLLTGTRCQSSFHLSEMCVCVCVCVCLSYVALCYLSFYFLSAVSPFSFFPLSFCPAILAFFFCHLNRPDIFPISPSELDITYA